MIDSPLPVARTSTTATDKVWLLPLLALPPFAPLAWPEVQGHPLAALSHAEHNPAFASTADCRPCGVMISHTSADHLVLS